MRADKQLVLEAGGSLALGSTGGTEIMTSFSRLSQTRQVDVLGGAKSLFLGHVSGGIRRLRSIV